MVLAGKLELSVEATVNKGQLSKEIEKAAKAFEKGLGNISFSPGIKGSGKGQSGGSSTKDFKNAFSSALKLFKIDLYWRWLKGMWTTINKYVPFLGALNNMLYDSLMLVFTALLLPFLPGILNILTWLLNASVGFFNYMQSLKSFSPSDATTKIITDVNDLFKNTDWASYGKSIGTTINNTLDFVDKFLTGIKWDEIGNSVGKAITGFLDTFSGDKLGTTIADGINAGLHFLTSMFEGVDWKKFGSAMGEAFSSAVKKVDWWGILDLLWSILKGIANFVAVGLPQGIVSGITGDNMSQPANVDWSKISSGNYSYENVRWNDQPTKIELSISSDKGTTVTPLKVPSNVTIINNPPVRQQ